MKLNVYATPDSVSDKALKDKNAVVIDVLRATSTILAALINGCREVIPAIEIEEVINMSKNYEKDAYLLCGERNIDGIDGFHLSNSPLEYTADKVLDKTLLFTTTNGTKAIRKVVDAREVIMCSITNVDVVAEHLARQKRDTAFVCAGTDGQFSMDDVITAGAVISRLSEMVDDLELSDLAVVAEFLYRNSKGNLHGLLENSTHYKRLMAKGLKADIDYCLTLNAAPVVGIFKDGVIRTLEKMQE